MILEELHDLIPNDNEESLERKMLFKSPSKCRTIARKRIPEPDVDIYRHVDIVESIKPLVTDKEYEQIREDGKERKPDVSEKDFIVNEKFPSIVICDDSMKRLCTFLNTHEGGKEHYTINKLMDSYIAYRNLEDK